MLARQTSTSPGTENSRLPSDDKLVPSTMGMRVRQSAREVDSLASELKSLTKSTENIGSAARRVIASETLASSVMLPFHRKRPKLTGKVRE